MKKQLAVFFGTNKWRSLPGADVAAFLRAFFQKGSAADLLVLRQGGGPLAARGVVLVPEHVHALPGVLDNAGFGPGRFPKKKVVFQNLPVTWFSGGS